MHNSAITTCILLPQGLITIHLLIVGMDIRKIRDAAMSESIKRAKIITIGALAAAILPALVIAPAIQSAAAISVSAAYVSLNDFCTTSTSDVTMLTVTVSNTNTKELSSSPAGYIQTQGPNNFGQLSFKLKSGGSTIDQADIDAQGSDLRDQNAGLSWYATTSTAKTVTLNTLETPDTVCAIANQSELLVYY